MARKGTKKVRTGCLTCKIRKVKCDEEKPKCARCTGTGRTCDGYGAPSSTRRPEPTKLSVAVQRHVLIRPKHQVDLLSVRPPAYNKLLEGQVRAIDFFRHVVAPSLSCGFQDDFWSSTVLQAAMTEPAVHHAVAALSRMFEAYCTRKRGPGFADYAATAMIEYNKAIQCIVGKSLDEGVVLLVCIIFIGIEFLRLNKPAAIAHCCNGVLIMNNMRNSRSRLHKRLMPIMRRLAVFPYFFGCTTATFPALDDKAHPLDHFESMEDAIASIDSLTSRATRLIRGSDQHRLEVLAGRTGGIPEALFAARTETLSQLSQWETFFEDWSSRSAAAGSDVSIWLSSMLRLRCMVFRIWLTAHFLPEIGEMGFDEHIDEFRQFIGMAYQALHSRNLLTQTSQADHSKGMNYTAVSSMLARSSFVMELGVLPLLYFVVLRCRNLELRLQALWLMRDLPNEREGLFSAAMAASIARRFVEHEHDVKLASWPWRGTAQEFLICHRRDIATDGNHLAWSQIPAEAVPENRRLWEALDLRALEINEQRERGGFGLSNSTDEVDERMVRFVRCCDGRLQHWDEMVRVNQNRKEDKLDND